MRVWFNRTFSSVYAAISLIREADLEGRFHLIYSNANPHALAGRVAHEFFIEPTGLDNEQYIDWCLAFRPNWPAPTPASKRKARACSAPPRKSSSN